jgi:hypothetical protein
MMTDTTTIDTFIEALRRRPWMEADWIAAIEHGLRMSIRVPVLWQKLRQVIDDDDELTVGQQLELISSITKAHRSDERRRGGLN